MQMWAHCWMKQSPWWQRTLEKVDVPNAAFTSAYSSKSGLQDPRLPEITGKTCSKEAVSLVGDEEVKKYLGNLDLKKSMGSEVLQVHDDLQMLREQVEVITRPLLIIWSWQLGEALKDWRISLLSPRMRTPGIIVQSASPQSLAMWWSNNSQKPFPGISKTRTLRGLSASHHSGEIMLDIKEINFYNKMTVW